MGGAESVLEALVDLFPNAPVFTTIYWRDGMPDRYRDLDIRTTWLDRAPLIYRHHQPYLPLYPLAVQSIDLSGYDLIISNKSGFCHGVRTAASQLHVDYCLTPTRYVWDTASYTERERLSTPARLALRPLMGWLKTWDKKAADGVDDFIAISSEVQDRIRRYYQRESAIIYPPVNVERYQPSQDPPSDFFLIASRLIPYKRIDLAVEACNRLGVPLVVVGEGRGRAALEAVAGPTIEFRGRVSDADLAWLLSHCRAFIFPGREDFGIAPVEAQAAGRPVIAFAAGGALDTVVDGETGIFFYEQSVQSLVEAIERFSRLDFAPARIRRQAERFSLNRFKQELLAHVMDRWSRFVSS